MNANTRIQWLHKKLAQNSYPNAQRLAERFHISHRQAQRDLDYLRRELEAPIAYDNCRKGFYYTEAFSLPLLLTSDNDEVYIPEVFNVKSRQELAADESIIQMQIPYTASVKMQDKLAAMEMSQYIVSKTTQGVFTCEFHSVERFIGLLISLDADFEVLEPAWLRERIVSAAERVIKNHTDATDK